jgi:fluoroacetyl-CoA thioesterase
VSKPSELQPGRTGTASLRVEERHTAMAVGSGSEPVFATPMMAALLEAAAVNCLADGLPSTETTLGVHLELDHIAATPVGHDVIATAELTAVDGRKLTFRAEIRDESEMIGRGTHVRVVVDRQKFAEKLQLKLKGHTG